MKRCCFRWNVQCALSTRSHQEGPEKADLFPARLVHAGRQVEPTPPEGELVSV